MTAKKTPATAAKKSTGKGRVAPPIQPSTFKPEYCKIAVDTLSQGHSMAGLAGRLKVARSTVYVWRERFPEFDEACEIGMSAAVYWWEQRAAELARTGKGNPAMVIFGLKNRASDDWRDRIEHTGAEGGAIQTVSEIRYTVVRPKGGSQ